MGLLVGAWRFSKIQICEPPLVTVFGERKGVTF